ncbi:hypothetical protein JD844_016587 [Phrynosoma platyrhinos]|uniref:Uncharacterized protein n=1 Tax=Phrynosoma platyrhinos TaxID=52577 RepID=A0ABQ7SKP1_PHRPL|nr:hypothetical protein JD844_016587 [Phrynosoma platyrhinos]
MMMAEDLEMIVHSHRAQEFLSKQEGNIDYREAFSIKYLKTLIGHLFLMPASTSSERTIHSPGERYGEIIAVGKLYPFYARKSPFLVDKFHEYFLGGVDDMAFASNNIFELTSQMLANGTRNITSSLAKSVEKKINYTERGVYFDMPSWATPSGRFGSAIAVLDFNEDGIMDLAVGAPSVGSQELSYREIYCNLGWSLLAADVDGDGNSDLVVGSPYAPGSGKQRGFVASFYSFFNRSSEGQLSVSDADWIVKGERDYAWFGSSLSSIQLHNKTLIGCYFSEDTRQAVGRVYGYVPPNTRSWFALTGDMDMGNFGSSLATGFLSVEGIPRQILVIGAPTQDSSSKFVFIPSVLHQAGKALMYDLTESAKPLLLSSFSGDRRFSRFGGDVHLSDLNNDGLDEIIVTSPLRSKDIMAGVFEGEDARIYIYSGNQTTSGNVTNHCKSWISPCPEDWAQYVIISPEEKSRFGSAVITVKSGQKNHVIVAAERSSVNARLSGRLFVYNF